MELEGTPTENIIDVFKQAGNYLDETMKSLFEKDDLTSQSMLKDE